MLGVALVLVASAVAGALYLVAKKTVDDIPTAELDKSTLATARENEAQNFLVIGSDERPPEMYDPEAAGKRSDTLMLVQLDPNQSNAKVLSLPRDTRVPIPGRGLDKVNSAFAYGGAQLTIETIRDFTGLPIHHYIEINFEGLIGLVDALGGVDICVDEPMRDPKANIWFGALDCYHVDGHKALVFARSRSMEILRNGKWEPDATADLGRIHRQQLFIRSVLKRALSVRAIGNWREVAQGVQKGVTIDEGLQLSQFLELYDKFQDFDPEKVDMKTVPGHPATIANVSYWVPDPDKLNPLLQSFGAVTVASPSPEAAGPFAPSPAATSRK